MGSTVEILVLQALAQQMQGDFPAALAHLERALRLAEPEGYARVFLDEGIPMAKLFRDAAARGTLEGQDYAGKLLAAFESESQQGACEAPLPTFLPSQPRIETAVQPAKTSLVEPLSQRELDVLRLFETELSGPEIAQELVVALSTVRTHTKSIYSKLNVNNRRAAVKRAYELHLL
jgi:LuxR family maltose regulon positive regulatory protein